MLPKLRRLHSTLLKSVENTVKEGGMFKEMFVVARKGSEVLYLEAIMF